MRDTQTHDSCLLLPPPERSAADTIGVGQPCAVATPTPVPPPAGQEVTALEAELVATQAELAAWQAHAEHVQLQVARQEHRYERIVTAYEHHAGQLRQTLPYRLGETLVSAFRSPRRLTGLPAALLALRRSPGLIVDALPEPWAGLEPDASLRSVGEPGETSEPRPPSPLPDLPPQLLQSPVALARAERQAARAAAARERKARVARAEAHASHARALQASDPVAAAAAAEQAYAADPQPWRAKWLAFRQYDAGMLESPARLLRGLPPTVSMNGSEQTRALQILAQVDWATTLPQVPPRASPAYDPMPRSLLYCAASALPWHTSGYTTRSLALMQAFLSEGVVLTAMTRAGYPWDRADSAGTPEGLMTHHEGVDWHHLRQPGQSLPIDVYVDRACTAIMRQAREARVAAIHAASNHINALPALIAARRLGVPFHYELRGLWELSRAAAVPGFDTSERGQLGLELEALVARAADQVFVISQTLADHVMQAWELDPQRVALLPNGVDVDRFVGINAPKLPRFTIGYAGALVAYEGLDLLVAAIARLRDHGIAADLLVMGDGPLREPLERQAVAAGITASFTGRLDPDVSRARLAGCHVVCLPRRQSAVTELVPPIKLVEAMALGLPVVVPDLPIFREEARENETAMFFTPDDADDLARAIADLAHDPAAAGRLGMAARTHVLATRGWHSHARAVAELLPQAHPDKASGAELDDADSVEEASEPPPPAEPEWHLANPEAAATALVQGDLPTVRSMMAAAAITPAADGAREWLRLGRLAAAHERKAEAVAAEEALAHDRSLPILLGAYAALQRAGAFDRCLGLMPEITHHPAAQGQSARERIQRLRLGLAGQLAMFDVIPPRRACVLDTVPDRLCYVLHNSLPFASGGYGTRAHGLSQGLAEAGLDVIVTTRPGFPGDVAAHRTTLEPENKDGTAPLPAGSHVLDEPEIIDGITYTRIVRPSRKGLRYVQYVPAAAQALEAHFRTHRPALVMAASNHLVALPALIAARRLGLPFVYEVRGFWEVTRLSRDAGYRDTATYEMQERLETEVCLAADRVLTLTEPMRDELVRRGVPADRIALAPNACDPRRFTPAPRDALMAEELGIPDAVPVIGYVGTFVDYEGLDDLARACATLKARGRAFRLLLVGNETTSADGHGPIAEAIRAIAVAGDFADWLIMPGRVPHEDVARWYSLIDICPFPRKPWPVCEMVSPMKPLEALAMGKAVLVPNLRALSAMIAPDRTGLVHAPGDPLALADALDRLLDDPDLRQRLGRAGRAWIEAERTWSRVGQGVADILRATMTDDAISGSARA